MPHYHIKDFTLPTLPQTVDGVTFHKLFKNEMESPDWIIDTSFEGKDFFIWLKASDNGYLLKAEKATRPSPNYYLQQALKSFAKISKASVESNNIPDVLKKEHLADTQSVLKNIDFFAENFPKNKDVSIEVGFGSGRHLLYQAQQQPDVLFIGIEIHKPSIEQVIKQIEIHKIDNLLLLDYDARIFLEFVPSNCVKQIFVHFPVPWDKKPTRRVISEMFIKESVRVLQPTGTLELRTDSENYFAYSLQTFLAANILDMQIKKNHDIGITSKYEDRWRIQEKNIYDIKLQGGETSPELEVAESFSFPELVVAHESFTKFLGTTIKYEFGFIHFERLYFNKPEDYIYRFSMGSFERPEHLYLKVTNNTVSYFPANPVASKSNALVHQELIKLITGTSHG
jgi:tRNA (guanine-N7-)-methyltransferase